MICNNLLSLPSNLFRWVSPSYGDIFKTHILGCPCVMISSPEAAKSVLVSRAHLFKPTYPPSKEKMIGPQALFFHQGSYHSNLKALVQSSFHPNRLRDSVLEIQRIVLTFLRTWGKCANEINALQEMKRVGSWYPIFRNDISIPPILWTHIVPLCII